MATKKFRDRTEDETAADFATGGGDVVRAEEYVDDTPEPDLAAEAGLTTVGTVEDDVPVRPSQQIPAATMENIMAMMVDALSKIAAGQANATTVATQALDQAARQQQPDNKFAPGINCLNPQGDLQYPKPKLKCAMYIPWEAEYESLSWEEIELLNLLEEGEFVVKRIDGSRIDVKVKMVKNLNGKPERLLMNSEVAFNDDNHWMMPPLTNLLRDILSKNPITKAAAALIYTMDEREDMVRTGQLPVSVGQR